MFLPDYLKQPPAWFHARILVGPGAFLTQRFAAANDITHVINCAHDDACPEWFSERFPDRYRCMDALDSVYANILEWYPRFETTLREFLRAPQSGTIYVHCVAGMNRSGFLALTYTAKHYNLPLEDLMQATQRQRACLFQNPVYRNQVKEFLNGCVSGPEVEGVPNTDLGKRDAGLSSSVDCAGTSGHEHPTGVASGGT